MGKATLHKKLFMTDRSNKKVKKKFDDKKKLKKFQ